MLSAISASNLTQEDIIVFGIFRKKPDRSQVAVETISSVLLAQLSLAGASVDDRLSLNDDWALGYIFGYHDGALQSFELGSRELEFAVMTASYQKYLEAQV